MGIEDILDAHDTYILKVTPRQLLQFAEAIIEKNTEKIAAILKGENGEKLVSTKETIRILGVCRKTLWAWEQSEEIIPVITHRRKYYRLADVERLAALHPISK